MAGRRRRKQTVKKNSDDTVFDLRAYDKRYWNEHWLKYSGLTNSSKMPLAGGTRMLRARRKDINFKPNRRLDRKSSKGMLFENEELRMRTIAINAEVEQGQHQLKKLRRENELLRREVWSLRDENSKMERMLKKGTDEDTDQEEYSDEEDSEELDEEEEEELEDLPEEDEETELQQEVTAENADVENEENLQKSTLLSPRRGSRTFDGLSVIDEQTEETTQTTEGLANSRASSLARIPPAAADANGFRSMNDPMDYPYFNPKTYRGPSRNPSAFGEGDWDHYGLRPASPYPYLKAAPIPSYDHRLQNIQEPIIPPLPTGRPDDPLWMVPSPDGAHHFPPTRTDYPLTVIQERLGPDVFIADTCTYLPSRSGQIDLIGVQSDLNRIEITHKSDMSPKNTSPMEEEPIAASSTSAQPTAVPDSAASEVEACLVSCQRPVGDDSRQTSPPNADEDNNATDDSMPRQPGDRSGAKSFQSKLNVTLKFSDNARKSPGRQVTTATAGPAKPARLQAPLKHEIPRLQTFPANAAKTVTPVVRVPTSTTSEEKRSVPASHSTPAVSKTKDIPIHEPTATAVTAPKPHSSSSSLDSAAVKAAPSGEGGSGLAKGQKTPPAPPPRTSSCPSTFPTLPLGVTAQHQRAFRKGKSTSSSQIDSDRETTAVETPVPAAHPSNSTNPLLMNEPIATSSPTMRPKFPGLQKTSESQRSPKLRKQSSIKSTTMDDTTDEGGGLISGLFSTGRKSKTHKTEPDRTTSRKLRKQSQISISSLENNLDRRSSRILGLNNISISSSSGLDSPTKTDRRTRRVSIKFNKRIPSTELEEERPGILTNMRSKSRCEEYDGTYSERERTNSMSSRASSLARRKLSTSSSRTVFHEEKIPWCGCWGNGCV